MKDLSLFPDENAKKQEERSALSSSPLQAKFKKTRRKSALTTISAEDEMRRVNGMWELNKVMSEKPTAGRSIHILTGGNIDLLSHLLWLLQFWPKVRRVFLSAWAISAVDILMCKRYLEEGTIGTLELLLGDIFPSKYKREWEKLMEMYDAGVITNIYNSAIHSKVMLIDVDDDTKIVIESSANCNMNPRIEQSCVTVSAELFRFYDVYLHGVLDEMNLDSRTFATFMTRASMLGARVEWHNMKKSCEQCKRRNAQAGHPVDDMEIERLAHEFGVWLEH